MSGSRTAGTGTGTHVGSQHLQGEDLVIEPFALGPIYIILKYLFI